MFRGAFTALVTPFRGGFPDESAYAALIERQIDAGIDGLVPCGTTGESATLNNDEHVRMIEVAVATARGRVPVIAGTGSNSTTEAIELSARAKECGANATLQVMPYYNKPTHAGLVAHMHAIADAVDLPVIVYNVPGRTAVDALPEAIAAMAEHPRIIGVKEATGDVQRVSQIRERCGEGFSILSGDDHTLLPFLAAGGDGVISVTSNVLPKLFADVCALVHRGELARARELFGRQLPLTRALFATSNPIGIKAATAMLGWTTPEVRLPLLPLADNDPIFADIEARLRTLELL